jgi:hypothetical protein
MNSSASKGIMRITYRPPSGPRRSGTRRSAQRLAAICMLAIILGCSRAPKRVPLPDLDPRAAAAKAIEQFDKNADGSLSADEIKQSPAIMSALSQIDTNGDKSVTADELSARMESWLEKRSAVIGVPLQVKLRGQPLVGATVRFVPEEFLGDAARPAEGVTNNTGMARMAHAPEDRPDPNARGGGVRIGFYRVEISYQKNGKELIPEKYNTKTELGQEIAADSIGLARGTLTFDLRS